MERRKDFGSFERDDLQRDRLGGLLGEEKEDAVLR